MASRAWRALCLSTSPAPLVSALCRAGIGPYTFIAGHIVAAQKYGYTPFHWYMLARDGKPIADDGSKMTFTTRGAEINQNTGKPMPDQICFDYQDGDTRYELTLTRQKTLVAYMWVDFAKGWRKELLKLIRYPGGYMRFSAATSLNCYQEGKLAEHYEKTGRSSRSSTSVRSTKNRWSKTCTTSGATIPARRAGVKAQ